MILEAVPKSPGICLTAGVNPKKPQLEDYDVGNLQSMEPWAAAKKASR